MSRRPNLTCRQGLFDQSFGSPRLPAYVHDATGVFLGMDSGPHEQMLGTYVHPPALRV